MPRHFTGWPEQAYEVLLRLDGVPSPDTREAVRADRERLVREPMVALLNELADANPRLGDWSVWRYGRNLWWWQHQCAVVRLARNVEMGLRFDLDGLHVKGAWHYPDPAQVRSFRAAVADEASGGELVRIIEGLPERYDVGGDVMKRGPREYPEKHPRVGLLRYRSLIAGCGVGSEESLRSGEVLKEVVVVAEELADLLSWLARYVTEPV
ncbi:DUF2461 family protein [Actinokineospora enzanensis]|uniref:DUF2461 family protein n=1 Tax=Actinokineospora enzanensis TaxID=155975 RepID=UPI000687D7E0|nr:DUF2461 family protein [Actinokineospora enzanensis]